MEVGRTDEIKTRKESEGGKTKTKCINKKGREKEKKGRGKIKQGN